MKKFFFEVDKKQLEKATEPKYVFCAPARVWAKAETEDDARAVALEKLRAEYLGSGTLLGKDLRLTKAVDLAVDWNYGYGDGRLAGTAEEKAALWQSCTK